MKLVLALITASLLGTLLWWSIAMGSAAHSCGVSYQAQLTESRIKSEAYGGDHHQFCSTTYDALSSWEDCINAIHTKVPVQAVAARLQPFVLNVLGMAGDQSYSIHSLKLEHDDQCKDEINTMFYPPVPEK